MNQKILLGSLAMDLKRVALGLHGGSFNTANRFSEEAFKRIKELEDENIDAKLEKLLGQTKQVLAQTSERTAEDLLMYSTLFQNQAISKF